jgi:hypothetical protein
MKIIADSKEKEKRKGKKTPTFLVEISFRRTRYLRSC